MLGSPNDRTEGKIMEAIRAICHRWPSGARFFTTQRAKTQNYEQTTSDLAVADTFDIVPYRDMSGLRVKEPK